MPRSTISKNPSTLLVSNTPSGSPIYVPLGIESVYSVLKPWIKGFIQKEYNFLDPNDQVDLEQEAALQLVQIYNKLVGSTRFKAESEYMFYVKAVVRNSIRDYILKSRSKFGISLYKLRRHKRQTEQSLTEFFTDVGDQHSYVSVESISMDEMDQAQRHQRRLDILSRVPKGGKGLTKGECQHILRLVLKEMKVEQEGSWEHLNEPPTLTRKKIIRRRKASRA